MDRIHSEKQWERKQFETEIERLEKVIKDNNNSNNNTVNQDNV